MGKTIIIVSHNIRLMESLVGRMVRIREGQIE